MKRINLIFFRNFSLLMTFGLVANLLSAQIAMTNTDATGYTSNAAVEIEKEHTVITNLHEVEMEISTYLKDNLNLPEHLAEFYNADVKLLVAMSITKEGNIENVIINSNEEDQWLEKKVKKELLAMKNLTPVAENNELVTKEIIIPIILDFDLD